MLTREGILGINDLPSEEVYVAEWQGSVFVRAFTGTERLALSKILASESPSEAAIVALCVVDAEGNRIFTEADVEVLAEKNGRALQKIVNAAIHFNTLTAEAVGEAKNG